MPVGRQRRQLRVSRHEPHELNGVSHMLEHMAFKGTERRSAKDIAVEMESVGASINSINCG